MQVRFRQWNGHLLVKSHSDAHFFSLYQYLFIILVVSQLGFWGSCLALVLVIAYFFTLIFEPGFV